MATPPVGLDITPTSLTAVTLKRKGKSYSLVTRAEMPLAPGIFVDGEVHDAEALGHAIRTLWNEHGIKERRVAVGIANQRCITRVIEKVRIKGSRKQLREALSFDVAEALPIPIEEAVWDFHSVERFEHPTTGVEMERHLVVMVYRESVERFQEALLAADLKPVRIDLAAFALMRSGMAGIRQSLRLAGEDLTGADSVVALLDIGPTSTNVVVTRGDVCELNRLVPFGRQHYTQTLVEQFGWDAADADRVASDAGIMPVGGVEQPGDPYADARRMMQYVTDQLANEIRTSFDYYSHSTGGSKIDRVVVAGEGALLHGIDQRLTHELGVPVSMLDVAPRLDAGSVEALGNAQARFGVALGLAMEEAA